MERVEERLGLLFVTPAALLHDEGPESRFVDARDRVRGMTIFASRMLRIGFRVIGVVDAGPELLLDPVVADPAGSSDVPRIDQCVRVLRGEFGVCTVAISACRRHDETAVYQTPAMNAVFIAADDVVHHGVNSCRRLLTNAMAGPAERRNIARVRGRRRLVLTERRVPGMTILARRRIRIAFRVQGSMSAALIFGDLFGVANTAIDLGLHRFAGALLGYRDIRVTLGTGSA